MDAAELKAMQSPLKDAYREDPARAILTLRARGALDDQSIACKVETGRALAVAGLLRQAARVLNCVRATCCSKRWWPARG